jgi:hypothetical protein
MRACIVHGKRAADTVPGERRAHSKSRIAAAMLPARSPAPALLRPPAPALSELASSSDCAAPDGRSRSAERDGGAPLHSSEESLSPDVVAASSAIAELQPRRFCAGLRRGGASCVGWLEAGLPTDVGRVCTQACGADRSEGVPAQMWPSPLRADAAEAAPAQMWPSLD